MSKLHSGRAVPCLCRALLALAGVLAATAHASELTENAPRAIEPSAVSAFAHYQPWREAPSIDWRAANQRAQEAGGWRAYLREASPNDASEGMHHGH